MTSPVPLVDSLSSAMRSASAHCREPGDHVWPCGCVTYWHSFGEGVRRLLGTALYRRACASHRRYAERLGILTFSGRQKA